jgi:hypothetical protein
MSSVTIILTSTVNVNFTKCALVQVDKTERLQTYLKAILRWIKETNFNIILVENSGHNFDELNAEKELYKDRFEVITFKENELEETKYLKYNSSKGASEIFAINYAFNNSRTAKQSNFIIKITARYFLDELENYLNGYNLNEYDCLSQCDMLRCEMIGSHINNFHNIFDINLLDKNGNYNGHIENIWNERKSQYKRILICKLFKIELTKRGGSHWPFVTI